jgi:hypothetical protein
MANLPHIEITIISGHDLQQKDANGLKYKNNKNKIIKIK